MAETKNLRGMAREVADLALSLAALPVDGRNAIEALSQVEYLALRILKEASVVRVDSNVRAVGETRGAWQVVPANLLPR